MTKSFISLLTVLLFVITSVVSAQSETSENQDVEMSRAEKKAERKRLNKEVLKGRRFLITTVFTYAALDSYLELTGPNGILGARLDLEEQFGFERQKFLPSFDLQYAFTRHSAIYAEYYSINRSSVFNVGERFEFENIVIPENAGEARFFLNTNIWSIGYMYSFINSSKANLSFFVNFFIMSVGTGLDVDSQNVSKRLNFTAPLPSFGYKFNYEIVPKLRFGGSHSFFFLEVGDFGGRINNLRLTLDYRATKWLGAGISYAAFGLDIDSKSNNLNGNIGYYYSGPGLFLQFIF